MAYNTQYQPKTSNQVAELFIDGAHANPRFKLSWTERGAHGERTIYQTKLSVKQVSWLASVRNRENLKSGDNMSIAKGFSGVIEKSARAGKQCNWELEIMPNGAGKLVWEFVLTAEQIERALQQSMDAQELAANLRALPKF